VSEAHESRLKTTSRATAGNSSAVVPAGQSTTSGAAAAPQMQVLLNSFEELRSRV
jgi:hypothetical protein